MRGRRRAGKRSAVPWIILAAAAAVVLILVFLVFIVKEVKVEGNKVQTDAQVQEDILSQKYSKSSLYLMIKYRMGKGLVPDYAESVTVTLESPQVLSVTVEEKELIGYTYDADGDQYIYFDNEGSAMLISKQAREGLVKVMGLEISSTELYAPIVEKPGSLFTYIENAASLLKQYEIEPEMIYVQSGGSLLLSYNEGKLQVNLGSSDYLNEKIVRVQKLMEKIQKKKGTLHMETWTEETTEVFFRKKELVELPDSEVVSEE